MAASGMPLCWSMVIKVSVFAVAMSSVAAGLAVIFGNFRLLESTDDADLDHVSR